MKTKERYIDSDVKLIRSYIKEKLLKKSCPTYSYPTEYAELLNLLKRTIINGESESALIVGPRGCEKSSFLDECLYELKADGNEYLVVKLNGLMHTDDHLALKAIIEQLNFNVLDGEQVAGSFSDNLRFMLDSLKSCERSTVPIIFILNEFQFFCNHKNQTLIYNLFDVTKSAQAPICVIGITTRYDITELLEKRVSSRFSHRQILLMPSCNLVDRIEVICFYLLITEFPEVFKNVSHQLLEKWNEEIKIVMSSPKVISCVRKQLDIEPSLKSLKNVLFSIISRISSEDPFITVNMFEDGFQKCYVDRKVEFLKDLSVLELCLIVSMAHQSEIFEGEPFNFEMIFKRYLKFAHQNSSVQITHRTILLKAFERIKELELILPITNTNRNQKKEYILYNMMVSKSQVRIAVSSYNGLPTEVSHWALGNVV